MGFLHVTQPSGTGFFVFPIEEENVQSRIPHDFSRNYSLQAIEPFVDAKTMVRLKTRVGSSRLSVVGLWPDEGVTKKWETIIGGETCLFVTKTALAGGGTVVFARRSRQLAEALFGKGAQGMYELLMLLVNVEPFKLTMDQFFEAIGRKTRTLYKEFTMLPTKNIQSIEDRFGSIYSFFEAAKGPPAAADANPSPGSAG